MILFPNAKINIGLNILAKRADGFHDISSIFYPLENCCDVLEITEQQYFSFVKSGIDIPDGKNLCELAYYLIKKEFNVPNVAIHLHKQIPIGSGLGGGSADGAFTLLGLNKLFDLGITNKQLKKYALQLGADCPFFIDNQPILTEGIGDILRPINLDLNNYRIKIINPGIHISTIETYKKILPKKRNKSLMKLVKLPIEKWKQKIKNDFENIIFKKYPELRKLKESLYNNGAIYASMTGSGSTIFGIFKK
ncbi:uncharacterized protein METZ01_LOCUS361989 [marine metagenome]|uniref:4-(cytidine 5'-diphospho)-2-C-methyl-D-erythritol kinase n=1 Tax=marine metagenome TaxID=408172 RepID=A0A382SI35_9ZZZZ